MSKTLIRITEESSGYVTVTDDFYYFEESGIRHLDGAGVGEDFAGNKYTVQFFVAEELTSEKLRSMSKSKRMTIAISGEPDIIIDCNDAGVDLVTIKGRLGVLGYVGTVEAVRKVEDVFEITMHGGAVVKIMEEMAFIKPGARIQIDYTDLTIKLLSPA